MKITKIEIKHFRGFPGPCTYTFDLPEGKNLLLYGENGSGKSSLYHALDKLFDVGPDAPSFASQVNIFGVDEHGDGITDGFVRLYLDDGSSLTWSQGADRPNDPRLVDAALRKGCLEYRSLLRTNFVEGNLDERLFSLAVEVLLARIPVPLEGKPRTIGEYWKDVPKRTTHFKRDLQKAESAISLFNQALKAVLPDVEKKATEMLDHFTDHHLKLHLEFQDLFYDRSKRAIEKQRLGLRIEFNGKPLPAHQSILNEARLSALALSLYLAAVLLSNPEPRPSVAAPLRLLVLDDVLIGLDLSNRLPILNILEKHFSSFQTMLLTYDRVWYELARTSTQDSKRWIYLEIFSERVGSPGYEVPLLRGGLDYLQLATGHLGAHDYRAAAVYARAALETRLKNFCDNKHLPVSFRKNPRQMTSEDFWNAVTGKQGGNGACHIDATTRSEIEALRKVVLNPLSHADANSITGNEVEAAIKAVARLHIT